MEHSISYNTTHWPGDKKRENALSTRFVCSNITMTFKTLLYSISVTSEGVPIDAESKGQGSSCTPRIFSTLDKLGPFLALGSNNKYSNKIFIKMLHLR